MTRRKRTLAPGPAGASGDLTTQIRVLSERSTGRFDVAADGFERHSALLVCRDKSSQKWGPRWLRQSGIESVTETDPDTVLTVVRSMSPDVIIVEACLVTADGEKVFQAIRGAMDIQIPVYALCGSTREVTEALDANVFDVARKPFDWQLLSRRIKATIAKSGRKAELEEMRESLTSALELANKVRKKLRETESFEPLTGLPNRSKFIDLVTQGMKAANRDQTMVAVFAIGFGRFRMIIEAMGQQSADRIVEEVAARLNRCLHDAGNLQRHNIGLRTAALGNTGAEQFGLMLTCSHDGDEIVALQRRITDELSGTTLLDGQAVYLSACVGVACYPRDADDAESLLLRSESAMREAQTRGGGFSFYNAEADARAARRFKLEHMLHEAIDRSELRVAYQPLTDIGSNRMVGVEALLRWPQPDGRFIQPEEFVPVAEDSGLMIRIGSFVLQESCRQLKAWHDEGLTSLRMCVNVSKCQLMSEDFASTVERTLHEHGLRPDRLELELSERGVLSGDGDLLDILLHLKRLGIALSIDDFGTGDAGIAYLKELPVDALKIDRSYVNGLADAGRDNAITSAMIALGQKLGMTVVAEGVESAEQLAILSSLGCDQYQGYYSSPAIFPDAISQVLRKG